MSSSQKPKYGGRGRPWHPRFIEYMEFIANHKNYGGMPDAFVDHERIQWEAPSNRGSGRFQHTHGRRLDWWRQKATEIGVTPNSNRWISKTAKAIHPTKTKPCKICGTILSIRYVYPGTILLKRLRALPFIQPSYPLNRLEPLATLIKRLVRDHGGQVYDCLPTLLSISPQVTRRLGNNLPVWLKYLDKYYIPSEPRLLSPGAMSNAPDRFDGFHSDNLCCRSTADRGRSKANLATYVTDRRVFEYWSSGDWVAADQLMGIIRSKFTKVGCFNVHPGPCAADHIGPLSLGFCHRAEFQLLCRACNGAKNNRMSFRDVQLLLAAEARGEQVISWHSEAIWNEMKLRIANNHMALRLSKLLRDNRHTFMNILERILRHGDLAFLLSLLELHCADYDVQFEQLEVKNHVTTYRSMFRVLRKSKYALEQKARRCRVAFEALRLYFDKTSRNWLVVQTPEIESEVQKALAILSKVDREFVEWNSRLTRVLLTEKQIVEEDLRKAIEEFPKPYPRHFHEAKFHLETAMNLVGKYLVSQWDADRYVRN
jgi:Alw26I/Eco31I/Esp3I family type II restriction endonuclease